MSKKEETTQQPNNQSAAAGYIRKRVNAALISLAHSPDLVVRVDGEMYTQVFDGLGGERNKEAVVCRVTDMSSGEVCMLLVPTVVQKTWEGMDEGYVGKVFELLDDGISEGKRYRSISVYELIEE